MKRPGVTFDLYNADSLVPEEQMPNDRKVTVQTLCVVLENLGSWSVQGEDYIIRFLDD